MDDRHFAFTVRKLEALPAAPKGKRIEYHDTEAKGLKLRVTDKGIKTFSVFRRIEGVMTRINIGEFGPVSLSDARLRAAQLNGEIARGANPAAVKRAMRQEPTFGELFDWYIDHSKNRKESTVANYKWLFEKHLNGLRKVKLSAISRADLRALHSKLTKAHGSYVANRAIVLVRAVFNAAIKGELFVGANPGMGIDLNKEVSREVRLLPSQLGAFLAAVEGYSNEAFRDFFMLCLLTGQRRENILSMRWADVHLADELWIIPETKNGRPQNVPLLEAELEILQRRKASAKGPWVFPSHGQSGHLVEPKGAWRTILSNAGIDHGDLRIHDLRRSFGSLMVDSGESLETIGKALGHMSQLTTAVYARMSLETVREGKRKVHGAIAVARQPQGGKVDVEVSRRIDR